MANFEHALAWMREGKRARLLSCDKGFYRSMSSGGALPILSIFSDDWELFEEPKYYLVNTNDYGLTECRYVNVSKDNNFIIHTNTETNIYKTMFTKSEWEKFAEDFGIVIAPGKFELIPVKEDEE